MNSLLQLSRTLQDARAEKEAAVAQALAHASADKIEAVAEARQEQFIKVCAKGRSSGEALRTSNCR